MIIKMPPKLPKTLLDIMVWLNELGAQDWEMCGREYGAFIFKRQIQPVSKPTMED